MVWRPEAEPALQPWEWPPAHPPSWGGGRTHASSPADHVYKECPLRGAVRLCIEASSQGGRGPKRGCAGLGWPVLGASQQGAASGQESRLGWGRALPQAWLCPSALVHVHRHLHRPEQLSAVGGQTLRPPEMSQGPEGVCLAESLLGLRWRGPAQTPDKIAWPVVAPGSSEPWMVEPGEPRGAPSRVRAGCQGPAALASPSSGWVLLGPPPQSRSLAGGGQAQAGLGWDSPHEA